MPNDETNNPYQKYFDTADKQEKLRMGYPLTGSIHGFFTTNGWEKSEAGSKLIDQSNLGIQHKSINDTLMLNIGDPESSLIDESDRKSKGIHYPEDIENEVIKILTKYFGSFENTLKGYVTSGGTEANLASIWWLRNYVVNLSVSQTKPYDVIVYASKQSHYSCAKVCRILNIQLIEINSTQSGQLDIKEFAETLQAHMTNYPQRPMIIWLNAGTTVLGAIDDLISVNQIINKVVKNNNGICTIHTDGAILGITLPLLHAQYQNLFEYTDTFAMSGHKLLATTSACGVVLAKKSIVTAAFSDRDTTVGYVHGIKDITITGGRSCLPIFQLHQSLKKLNIDGNAKNLRKLIDQCLKNATFLAVELKKIIGFNQVICNPNQFNVVFPLLMSQDKQELIKEKYTLMPLPSGHACITVFPNVDQKLILSFLNDYKAFQNEEYVPSCKARL